MTSIPTPLHLVQTKHTHDCLAQRLKELAPVLYRCFPAYAADCGLDAAECAGMKYIDRVQAGTASDLVNGEAYLRKIAFRAARRCQNEEPSIVATSDCSPQTERSGRRTDGTNMPTSTLPSRLFRSVSGRHRHSVSSKGCPYARSPTRWTSTPQTVDRYIKRGVISLRKVLSENMPDCAGAVAS